MNLTKGSMKSSNFVDLISALIISWTSNPIWRIILANF